MDAEGWRETQPVKPATIAAYHRRLRACFNWLVGEGLIEASPFARIPAPDDRADTIGPFSDEQVNALLSAARHFHHPKRDEAILYFLLDTGIRASELCALRWRDVDMSARRAVIQEGKGGKSRPISFGKTAAKSLFNYVKADGRDDDAPLFTSAQGNALTRSGLLQLIGRLAKVGVVRSVRCSPHTFRHTFAVSFLRNGGNQFSLTQQLGHTDLKMTLRYVRLAHL